MKIKLKINISNIITLLMIISCMYYFIPITNIFINSFVMFFINGAILFFILVDLFLSKISKESLITFISLTVIAFIFFVIKSYYKNGILGIYSLLYIFNPILVALYLFEKSRFTNLKYLAFIILFSLAITSFTTFIGLEQNPELARVLATISDSESTVLYDGLSKNIGGYDIVYSLVIATPIIYYLVDFYFQNKKYKFLLKIIIFLFLIIFIIDTQYTTALLMLFVISLLNVIFRKINFKYIIIWGTILLLGYNFIGNNLTKTLYSISDGIDSQIIASRLIELADMIDNGNADGDDISERSDAYEKSILLFKENYLLGNWYNEEILLGGHSTILDTLALGGSLLFLVILFCFTKIVNFLFSSINGDKEKKCMVMVLVCYIILAAINPVISGSFFSIIFITPIGLFISRNENNKRKRINKISYKI